MATTKTKKNTKEVVVDTKKSHPLLKNPRMTEKAALGAEKGIYTFNVRVDANKSELKKAINLVYGVKPERISITQIKAKTVVRRGKVGTKQRGKKAVVYLKKGDKIVIV